MKLIVGLGNPGKKYDNTRHNIGFRIADQLADSENIKFKRKWSFKYAAISNKAIIIKPMTFMNLSGKAALEARNYFSPDETLVIADDIYLPLGVLRLRQKGSDGGHKGIRSIIGSYETDAFLRLKIGISSNPDDVINQERALSSYVLARFTSHEEKIIAKSVSASVEILKIYIENGLEEALKAYSRYKLTENN